MYACVHLCLGGTGGASSSLSPSSSSSFFLKYTHTYDEHAYVCLCHHMLCLRAGRHRNSIRGCIPWTFGITDAYRIKRTHHTLQTITIPASWSTCDNGIGGCVPIATVKTKLRHLKSTNALIYAPANFGTHRVIQRVPFCGWVLPCM